MNELKPDGNTWAQKYIWTILSFLERKSIAIKSQALRPAARIPLSFWCANAIMSYQIIQLVNKSKFLWSCLLFKWPKLRAVASAWAWWFPVTMEPSIELFCLQVSGCQPAQGERRLQSLAFTNGSDSSSFNTIPLTVRASSKNLTHKPRGSQVQIVPLVSRCSSI